jgi:hypothetical protein
VQSWQGGSQQSSVLTHVTPGVYRAATAVPTGGTWKSIVFLMKGDVIVATPVSMPEDRQYALPAVPVAAQRTAVMVPASNLLLRETHDGAAWPMVVAYTGFALTVALWISTLAVVFTVLARRSGGSPPERPVAEPVAARSWKPKVSAATR